MKRNIKKYQGGGGPFKATSVKEEAEDVIVPSTHSPYKPKFVPLTRRTQNYLKNRREVVGAPKDLHVIPNLKYTPQIDNTQLNRSESTHVVKPSIIKKMTAKEAKEKARQKMVDDGNNRVTPIMSNPGAPLTEYQRQRTRLHKWANPLQYSGLVDEDNLLTSVLEVVNPYSWADHGFKSRDSFKEGDVVGGIVNLMGAMPFIPSAVAANTLWKIATKRGRNAIIAKGYGKKLAKETAKDIALDEAVDAVPGFLTKKLRNQKAYYDNLKFVREPKNLAHKSSLDWGKWNKEIPMNKPLMKEYGEIEAKAVADGTWMKNSDGSKFTLPDGELGTPEQFVQIRSKSFKEAFPDFDVTYRGASTHNTGLIDKPEFTGVFTGDKDLAGGYTLSRRFSDFFKHGDPTDTKGVHQLALKKSDNSVKVEGFGDDWQELRFNKRTDAFLDRNIKATENHLKLSVDNNINPGRHDSQRELIKDLHVNSKSHKELSKGDNHKDMVNYFEGKGDVSTDDVASYLEAAKIDNIKIRNLVDGSRGDITISNQVGGNYLKSLRGNNGMFDMNNPSIYKVLLPAIGLGGYNALKENRQTSPQASPTFKQGGSIESRALILKNRLNK